MRRTFGCAFVVDALAYNLFAWIYLDNPCALLAVDGKGLWCWVCVDDPRVNACLLGCVDGCHACVGCYCCDGRWVVV